MADVNVDGQYCLMRRMYCSLIRGLTGLLFLAGRVVQLGHNHTTCIIYYVISTWRQVLPLMDEDFSSSLVVALRE